MGMAETKNGEKKNVKIVFLVFFHIEAFFKREKPNRLAVTICEEGVTCSGRDGIEYLFNGSDDTHFKSYSDMQQYGVDAEGDLAQYKPLEKCVTSLNVCVYGMMGISHKSPLTLTVTDGND